MNKSSTYYKKYHLQHTCKFCGKKISLSHWNSRRLCTYSHQKRVPQFCNYSCSTSYITLHRFPKGKNHPAYTTGVGRGHSSKVRKQALLILGMSCCECAKTNPPLHVHHKDGNPKNNNLSNIEILCIKCHRKKHRKYKSDKECQKHWSEINKKKWHEKKATLYEQKFQEVFGTKQYYYSKDLCKILRISRERVRQLRKMGKIPYIQVGKICLHYFNQKKGVQ